MFEILFLGTSASAPSAKRGLSAQIVNHDEYRFLIDCGEGTQRQILQSGAGFKHLNRILLTHGHLDHILGLAGAVLAPDSLQRARLRGADPAALLADNRAWDFFASLDHLVVTGPTGTNANDVRIIIVGAGT